MQAAWFEHFGNAIDSLVVGEWQTPSAGAGEVLVRMASSGVNPSDVKKRAGAFPDLLDAGPVIPHSDGAGVIEAVGPGVDPGRVGQRVWVYQAQYGRRFGTAAEYLAIEDCRAPVLPETASFAVGACLGIPVMTAHRCVFADGAVAGQTLLVTGGAGRVGYYAIQWAVAAGATVFATASNPADRATCLELGARAVVNHRQPGWGKEVRAANGGGGVDRVIDVEFGANLPEVLGCIRTGGVIASYSSTVVREPQLPFLQMMYQDLTIRLVIVYAMPEEAKQYAISDIDAALRAETLRHRVAHELPLAEIARSHELIETGGFGGCVVLAIG
jgi:NADPH:quinone reductase-like Zn-dependent oxidoreductase